MTEHPQRLVGPVAQSVDRSPPEIVLVVTPLGAFACGALLVSLLSLAFVLGRRLPPTPTNLTETTSALRTIEEVRQQPPIRYDELPIDRGTLR